MRVDVDTFVGMRDGVPALVELLGAAGVTATFFFSFGPDNSGRAVARAWRRPGFLAKMWRTNALSMYGLRTALSGTLLPAPRIATGLPEVARAVRAAGHEVGVHAWDHCRWQDRAADLPEAEVAAELDRAFVAFRQVFGVEARTEAAPAWLATGASLRALEGRGLAYASDTRGTGPFFPVVEGVRLATLQVPVTLPTLDEELGRGGVTAATYAGHVTAQLRPGCWNVYCVHAEAEGRAARAGFRDLLRRWHEAGARIAPLAAVADAARAAGPAVPAGAVRLAAVPGRAGCVAVQADPA